MVVSCRSAEEQLFGWFLTANYQGKNSDFSRLMQIFQRSFSFHFFSSFQKENKIESFSGMFFVYPKLLLPLSFEIICCILKARLQVSFFWLSTIWSIEFWFDLKVFQLAQQKIWLRYDMRKSMLFPKILKSFFLSAYMFQKLLYRFYVQKCVELFHRSWNLNLLF